ncbi:MAG TPA: AraC family transcriptional regulator [Flavitalea sp.]|nr:AraC family transcriptional regulator [Flavitalea sp.]
MLNNYDFVKDNPSLFKQFSCKKLLFLIMDCPPDFAKSEDWSEHNCFLHVLSGKKHLYNRERSWYIEKGSTVFLKKGGIGIEKFGNEPFCVLLFYVPDEYICSFVRENIPLISGVNTSVGSKDQVLPVQTNAVMNAFYGSILAYFSSSAQPPENLLELKFRELLLNLIGIENNPALTSYFCELAHPRPLHDLQNIMEDNCLYNLHLHEFARLCHRSLSSFKRDFQNAYKKAPGQWLMEKRLDVSRRLLLNSDKPVRDVVIESGFKNNTHFDRVFKKHFGLSPLQYRKQTSSVTA